MRAWDKSAVIYCKECGVPCYVSAYYSKPEDKFDRDINSDVHRELNKSEKKGYKTAIIDDWDGKFCECRKKAQEAKQAEQPSLLGVQP